MFHEVI